MNKYTVEYEDSLAEGYVLYEDGRRIKKFYVGRRDDHSKIVKEIREFLTGLQAVRKIVE